MIYIYIYRLSYQVTDLRIYNILPTRDRLATEEAIAIVTAKGKGTEIGAGVLGIRGVPATSISRTLGASADAAGAIRRMEGIIGIPTPTAIGQLVPATIVGRNRETIVGKRIEMTEWAVDGATIEAVEEEEKSTGRSPLPGMNDWRWSYSALEILGSILANTRISQLRLPERIYRHTSHL